MCRSEYGIALHRVVRHTLLDPSSEVFRSVKQTTVIHVSHYSPLIPVKVNRYLQTSQETGRL